MPLRLRFLHSFSITIQSSSLALMSSIFEKISQFLLYMNRTFEFLRQTFQPTKIASSAQPMTSSQKFKSNWLQWPVDRSEHGFRAFVVEPREYCPEAHTSLFNAAIKSLTEPPEPLPVGSYSSDAQYSSFKAETESFDLITFPEAFLPKDDLLAILKIIRTPGCIHVGLRPSVDTERHLFSTVELQQLIHEISETVPDIVDEDLTPFSEWLNEVQNRNQNFNVACLFTIDSDNKTRVCLHPKIVSSNQESRPLHDKCMKEADLFTLVTLLPTNRSLLSITIQPLICADVLSIGTNKPNHHPLSAISSFADCFDKRPPDHVDIISVTTCTKQQKLSLTGRKWHQEFRDAFINTAKSLVRYHSAVFILSNFNIISKSALGGLSGAFMPIPFYPDAYPDDVIFSVYGRSKEDLETDNQWFYRTTKDLQLENEISNLCYIAALDSTKNIEAAAYMLGFTIYQLPRHNASWPASKKNGLKNFQLREATYDCQRVVTFKKRY